jgi:hypothetical protein
VATIPLTNPAAWAGAGIENSFIRLLAVMSYTLNCLTQFFAGVSEQAGVNMKS